MLRAVRIPDRNPLWFRAAAILLGLALTAAACSTGKASPRGASTSASSRSSSSSHPSTAAPSATKTPNGSIDVYAAATGGILERLRSIPERVYVPNSIGNSITVIDPATFKVIDTYPVGVEPQHVTPSRDMRWLYVDQGNTGNLTVIDPRTGKVARIIPNVTDPYNLYFTPDGTKAVVVAEDNKR